MNRRILVFLIFCLLLTSAIQVNCSDTHTQNSLLSRISSASAPETINSEGKDKPEGHIKSYVSGTCGKDYGLVSPKNAQVWKINVTLVSELSSQYIHVTVYEVIGEYPYNYEEQLITPRASGLGSVSLIATLNVSRAYEIWIRDAYAKQFTGYVEETWNPYILNGRFEQPVIYNPWTIPSWGSGGTVGVGLPSYIGNAIQLHQWSTIHGSEVWQEVDLDKMQLVLLFWLKPFPENHEINFQVLFDGIAVFNNTYTGSNSQYDWNNVSIILEPIFWIYHLTTGAHEIRFHVSKGIGSILDPMPSVAIDEVSILSTNELFRYLTIYEEYAKLRAEYEDYRNTHNYTNEEVNNTLNDRNQWMSRFNLLNATYTQYIETHSHSDDEYDSLLLENQRLTSNFGTSQSLNYVLIVASIILLAITTYFAKRKS